MNQYFEVLNVIWVRKIGRAYIIMNDSRCGINIIFILWFETSSFININKRYTFSIFISYNSVYAFEYLWPSFYCNILFQCQIKNVRVTFKWQTLSIKMSLKTINFDIRLQVSAICLWNYNHKWLNTETTNCIVIYT